MENACTVVKELENNLYRCTTSVQYLQAINESIKTIELTSDEKIKTILHSQLCAVVIKCNNEKVISLYGDNEAVTRLLTLRGHLRAFEIIVTHISSAR